MSKPKILFLAESLNVGGAEKALVSILNILDYSRFEITLMLISESGTFLNDIAHLTELNRKSIAKPTSNKFHKLINALKIKTIYKWLPASWVGNYLCNGYDTVIAFCEGYLTKWVAAASIDCKKIAWVHTDMVTNNWPVKTGIFSSFTQEMAAYHKFNNVIAVSENVAQGLRNIFNLENVFTIYNIIDPDIIKKSITTHISKPKNRLNLVSVGRLEPIKGYHNLIESLNILVNDKKLDISLCLVGDGTQRKELETAVDKYALREYVHFAGSQPNPYPYIAAADAYICTSLKEGFNIAILEAMTLGKPIIATNSAGPEEILNRGEFGILIKNGISEIVDAITSIYINPEILKNLSSYSIQRSKTFGAENQLRKFTSIIR